MKRAGLVPAADASKPGEAGRARQTRSTFKYDS